MVRNLKDKAFYILIILCSAAIAIPLIAIIVEVFVNGYKQINFSFFTDVAPSTFDAMIAKENGERISGGIANGITGTLLMVLTSAIVAIP